MLSWSCRCPGSGPPLGSHWFSTSKRLLLILRLWKCRTWWGHRHHKEAGFSGATARVSTLICRNELQVKVYTHDNGQKSLRAFKKGVGKSQMSGSVSDAVRSPLPSGAFLPPSGATSLSSRNISQVQSCYSHQRPLVGVKALRVSVAANVSLLRTLSTFRGMTFTCWVWLWETDSNLEGFPGGKDRRDFGVLVGRGPGLEKAKLEWGPGRREVQKMIIKILSVW